MKDFFYELYWRIRWLRWDIYRWWIKKNENGRIALAMYWAERDWYKLEKMLDVGEELDLGDGIKMYRDERSHGWIAYKVVPYKGNRYLQKEIPWGYANMGYDVLYKMLKSMPWLYV